MNLVIGGTGFLGAEITRQLLSQGKKVRILCRRKNDAPEGAEVFYGDIRNPEAVETACEGVETVFHTASIPSITVFWEPFFETNVQGAKNVVDACIKKNVKKLIYTSSASVCFSCVPQLGVNESEPYPDRFLAHYPHSKAIAEKMILEKASDNSGLLTCSLRPHLIIGKHDRHLFPRLFQRAERKRLFRVGNGKNQIDIIFVENAAAGHIQAAEALTSQASPVNGNAYFLSQGEPVNCWNWINEILTMKGLPKVKRSIPFWAAWNLGAAMEVWYKVCRFQTEPLMTRFLAAQLGQSHYLDISRAKRDFGYKPLLTMEEGMSQLAEQFRERKLY